MVVGDFIKHRQAVKAFCEMKRKLRTKITVETQEVTTVHLSKDRVFESYCETCRVNTAHLAVPAAATALNLSTLAVLRLIEAGEFHYVERDNGKPLICTNSLGTPPTRSGDDLEKIDPKNKE